MATSMPMQGALLRVFNSDRRALLRPLSFSRRAVLRPLKNSEGAVLRQLKNSEGAVLSAQQEIFEEQFSGGAPILEPCFMAEQIGV
ncbi:hypothetical protein DPMN_154230 [Dreissena polymorpha]|uniref:Uncharacterized protein n=1 Tax=Dreissena polymorpha TaxID=45954 RepID=A0A9D4FQE0_DREPO|nr:hypothetical protein DPMN_154230 [Dreissena polymorpha]